MQTILTSSTVDETLAMAEALANQLSAGDAVFLKGPVGAGKTLVARRIIQHLQSKTGPVEEVPSPTFTLVQTYLAGELEIWHSDLYRLTTLDELYELGLMDAMDEALVLVEWPERMGDLLPDTGLTLRLELGGDSQRNLVFDWNSPKWTEKISKMTRELRDD